MQKKRCSLLHIKQRIPTFVKMGWLVFIACVQLSPVDLFAQNELDEDEKSKEAIRAMDLPEIEARQYEVAVVRTSGSGRVYLMEDRNQSKPRVGKVLLLKRNLLAPPTMAIRIIRVYEDKNQFAAKRIKRYGNVDALDPRTTLMAIEKVAELKPYQTIEDEELKEEAELDELERPDSKAALAEAEESKNDAQKGGRKNGRFFTTDLPKTKKFDSDLDAEAITTNNEEIEEAVDESELYVADKTDILDPDRHLFGVDFASVTNINEQGANMFYSGASVRYGFTFSRKAFFLGRTFQDSMTFEAMLYYYKAYNLDGTLDSYTLLPISGILRENFHLSDSITLFIYGGVLYNFVAANVLGSDTTSAALSGMRVAAGAGFLTKIGPRWNIRVNGGIDSICVGLALRF